MSIRDQLMKYLGMPVCIPSVPLKGKELGVMIEGRQLHVRCRQTEITMTTEAIGSAFLLPATRRGRRLKGGAVDPVWLSGTAEVTKIAHQWWGWKAKSPDFEPLVVPAVAPPATGVGLAFSLGVDSFYSCFFADPLPDWLVLAGGFDVPVERQDILDVMADSVAEIAGAIGGRWAMVETDLRQHRLFKKAKWGHSHGGALALLGHVLSEYIGVFYISSSLERDNLHPWGSHPDLDPLWSSRNLEIRHVGHDTCRSEKVRRLLSHPLARDLIRRHLRVCWESPSLVGNCGRCHKCVALRVNLHLIDPDFYLETMPSDIPLAEAIEALPPLRDELALIYRRELLGGDPRIDAAMRAYIERSEKSLWGMNAGEN